MHFTYMHNKRITRCVSFLDGTKAKKKKLKMMILLSFSHLNEM